MPGGLYTKRLWLFHPAGNPDRGWVLLTGNPLSTFSVKHCLACLTLAACLTTPSADAQQWTGAIKLGGATTNFRGHLLVGPTTWQRVTGLSAAVAFGLHLGHGLLPQVELHYVQMGAKTAVKYLGIPVWLQSDLAYLSIPLLAQYRLATRGTMHPRLFAGPFVAFQMSAYLTLTPRDAGQSIVEQDQSVEPMDYGFTFGAGIDFEVASQLLTAEVRYTLGMHDITIADPILGDPKLENTGIVFMVGLHY